MWILKDIDLTRNNLTDGNEIEDRLYNQIDFDRNLVLDERTKLVARKVTEFLEDTNRYDKTIVFCEDIEHAERMRRALVNENADLMQQDSRYIMRITGDSKEGKAELDNFIDPAQTYPVIVTTSKLMTTGVDAQTCKLIVLDRGIGSMTEFKQIVGRGTRINTDYDKYYFTIMDFKGATKHFADPDFDGEPVQVYEPNPESSPTPPQGNSDPALLPEGATIISGLVKEKSGNKQVKIYIDGVPVTISSERAEYLDASGQLITESFKDFTVGAITREYRSLDEFLTHWNEADKKTAIIHELTEQGVSWELLQEEIGDKYSAFDLVCHIAFDQPPLTRRERANNVRKQNYFARYEAKARAVLEALLDKYADEDVTEIESNKVLQVSPFTETGTPLEIAKLFGGKKKYEQAVAELVDALYAS